MLGLFALSQSIFKSAARCSCTPARRHHKTLHQEDLPLQNSVDFGALLL